MFVSRAARHARRLLVATALVGSVAVVGACGSDDDDDGGGGQAASTTAAQPASTAPKPTGRPIRVMVVTAVDTNIQSNPDIFAGAKAAANAINAAGGVHGQPIEILTCNDKSDPNGAVACGREAVKEKVDAVSGWSIGTPTMLPILEAAGIQYIGGQVSGPADYTAPNAWPLDGGSAIALIAIPTALKAEGAKKVVAVIAELAASRNNLVQVEQGAKAAGLEYVDNPVTIPLDATDYAPYVQQLKQSGADSASVSGSYQQILQLTKAAKELGLDMKFGNQTLSISPDLLKELGEDANGMAIAGSLPSVYADIPSMKQFNKEMDAARDAGVPDTENRRSVTQDAWLGIHAIGALGEGIKGTVDKASLTEALKTQKDVDVAGLFTWTPSAPGPKEYPRLANGVAYPMIVKDGKVMPNGEGQDMFALAGFTQGG